MTREKAIRIQGIYKDLKFAKFAMKGHLNEIDLLMDEYDRKGMFLSYRRLVDYREDQQTQMDIIEEAIAVLQIQ